MIVVVASKGKQLAEITPDPGFDLIPYIPNKWDILDIITTDGARVHGTVIMLHRYFEGNRIVKIEIEIA